MRRCFVAIVAVALVGGVFSDGWAAPPKAVYNLVALPEVPRELIAEAPPLRNSSVVGTTTAPRAGAGEQDWLRPVNLQVVPGVNQIVVVSVGHMNRIVTPFLAPDAATATEVEHEVKGNVIYVAPKDGKPVTMFVTQDGDQSTAISLTLAPREVPPQEIRLSLGGPGHATLAYGNTEVARAWEESNGYVDSLRNALRELALERLPQGYSLRRTEATDPVPACRPKPGVNVDFKSGQSLSGANFEIRIGTVSNASGSPVELEETWCATSSNVAALAFWPYPVLEPGQKTEIYVALRRGAVATPSSVSARPALVK